MKFDELEISPVIMRGITEMGFEEATPIQAKAIPAMMEGKDVIGPEPVRQQPLEYRYYKK